MPPQAPPSTVSIKNKGNQAGHTGRETFSAPRKAERATLMEQQKMVKVSVEVRSSTARFRVGVQAKGIREALCLVGGRYPQGEVMVAFPIEPEGFFVQELTARAEIVGTEQAHQQAA
jgi:hypothetical protein